MTVDSARFGLIVLTVLIILFIAACGDNSESQETDNSPSYVVESMPSKGSAVAPGSLFEARIEHTATLLANGRVLAAGGVGRTDVELASAELYDPDSGTWSATASMKQPRHRHTATLLLDGRVLALGGKVAQSARTSLRFMILRPTLGPSRVR